MKKARGKASEATEGLEPVSAWTEEVTPEAKRTILRARAKSLALAPGEIGEAEESFEILAFLLARETYGIETPFIREVYPLTELTSLPCTPAYISGIINLRGQILTIIDMKKFFSLPEKGIANLNKVIVVQKEDMEMGILADEIIGVMDIPQSGLNPPLPTMTGIHAGYIKGVAKEGITLLDMEAFLKDKQLIVHEEVRQ